MENNNNTEEDGESFFNNLRKNNSSNNIESLNHQNEGEQEIQNTTNDNNNDNNVIIDSNQNVVNKDEDQQTEIKEIQQDQEQPPPQQQQQYQEDEEEEDSMSFFTTKKKRSPSPPLQQEESQDQEEIQQQQKDEEEKSQEFNNSENSTNSFEVISSNDSSSETTTTTTTITNEQQNLNQFDKTSFSSLISTNSTIVDEGETTSRVISETTTTTTTSVTVENENIIVDSPTADNLFGGNHSDITTADHLFGGNNTGGNHELFANNNNIESNSPTADNLFSNQNDSSNVLFINSGNTLTETKEETNNSDFNHSPTADNLFSGDNTSFNNNNNNTEKVNNTDSDLFGNTPRTPPTTDTFYDMNNLPDDNNNKNNDNPTADNLFGNPTTTAITSPTSDSLFGDKPTTFNIFGDNNTSPTTMTSDSLFGNNSSPTADNLFGNPTTTDNNTPTTPPSNIFGDNNTPPTTSEGLFGESYNNNNNNSSSPTADNLFGNPTPTATTTTTTTTADSLFGESTKNNTSENLFGNSNGFSGHNNVTTADNLFGGSNTTTTADNLFGNSNNNDDVSSLFSNSGTSSASSLFGGNSGAGFNSAGGGLSFFDALHQQRLEQERLEKERLEQERLDMIRLEQERAERQRIEQQQIEQQRLERQRIEQQRLEQQQRMEQQRLEQQQRFEQQRLNQQQQQQQFYNNNNGNNQMMGSPSQYQNYPVVNNNTMNQQYYQPPPLNNNAPPIRPMHINQPSHQNQYTPIPNQQQQQQQNNFWQQGPPPQQQQHNYQPPMMMMNMSSPLSASPSIPLAHSNPGSHTSGSINNIGGVQLHHSNSLNSLPIVNNHNNSTVGSNSSSSSGGSVGQQQQQQQQHYNSNPNSIDKKQIQQQNNNFSIFTPTTSVPFVPLSNMNNHQHPPPPITTSSHQRTDSGSDQFTKLLNGQVRGQQSPQQQFNVFQPTQQIPIVNSNTSGITKPYSPSNSISNSTTTAASSSFTKDNLPTIPSANVITTTSRPIAMNIEQQSNQYQNQHNMSPYRPPPLSTNIGGNNSPSTSVIQPPLSSSHQRTNSGNINLQPPPPLSHQHQHQRSDSGSNQFNSNSQQTSMETIPTHFTPMSINEYQPNASWSSPSNVASNSVNNNFNMGMMMGSNQQQQFNNMNVNNNMMGSNQQQYQNYSNNPIRTNPMLYTRPHPVIAFGFGGKFLVIKNNIPGLPIATIPTQQPQQQQTTYGNKSSILQLKNLLSNGNLFYQNLSSFPGPLSSASSKDNVNKWIQERINDISSRMRDDLKDSEASMLLWEILKHLCNNYGQINTTPAKEPTQDSSSNTDSILNLLVVKNQNQTIFPVSDIQRSEVDQQYLLNEIQRLVISGNIPAAHKMALENQIWHHALILASQLGGEVHSKTVQLFTNATLPIGSPLKTLYSLYSNNIRDLFKELNAIPNTTSTQQTQINSVFLDKWKENIATILFNGKSSGAKVIGEIGDHMWAIQKRPEAAHVCYLLADLQFGSYGHPASRIVLLGGDHKLCKNYITIESLQRSEIYEYSKILGNSQYSLPILFVYKFIYATILADFGLMSESLKYINHIKNLLKNHQITNPNFIYQLDTFTERITSYNSANKLSSSGSWISIPSILTKGFRILGKQSSSSTLTNTTPTNTGNSTGVTPPNITSPISTPVKPMNPIMENKPIPSPNSSSFTNSNKKTPVSSNKKFDEDEDLYSSFSNTKSTPKSAGISNDISNTPDSTTGAEGEEFKTKDEEEQPKSWFKSIFTRNTNKPKQMILETNSQLYFNETLGQWVEKGKEAEAIAEAHDEPPPPSAMTSSTSFTPPINQQQPQQQYNTSNPSTPPISMTNSNNNMDQPPMMMGSNSPLQRENSSNNLPPMGVVPNHINSSVGSPLSGSSNDLPNMGPNKYSMVSPNNNNARRKPRYVDTFNQTVYTGSNSNTTTPQKDQQPLKSSFTAFVPSFDPNATYQPPNSATMNPEQQQQQPSNNMDQPPMMNYNKSQDQPPMMTPYTPPPNQ